MARLVERLRDSVDVDVLTPCPDQGISDSGSEASECRCFRYAPSHLQILAHQPGGIQTALKDKPWSYLLLPGFLVSMLVATFRLARQVGLIHANWSVNGVIAGLACKLAGRPVITTLRGADANLAPDSVYARFSLGMCLRLNDRVVCVSDTIRDEVAARFPAHRSKLMTIHNGVDDAFLNVRQQSTARESMPLRLLFVGSLIPRKGVHTLLQAMHIGGPDSQATLTIIGDGPERERLRTQVDSLGLSGRVVFVGSVPPTEVAARYGQADCLVLPSVSEGRPNVVLESMAAGLPVVASRIAGVTELVSEDRTGLLFALGDAGQLAEHIACLEGQPDLRLSMGRAARARIVAQGLTWEHAAQQYLKLYQVLLS